MVAQGRLWVARAAGHVCTCQYRHERRHLTVASPSLQPQRQTCDNCMSGSPTTCCSRCGMRFTSSPLRLWTCSAAASTLRTELFVSLTRFQCHLLVPATDAAGWGTSCCQMPVERDTNSKEMQGDHEKGGAWPQYSNKRHAHPQYQQEQAPATALGCALHTAAWSCSSAHPPQVHTLHSKHELHDLLPATSANSHTLC